MTRLSVDEYFLAMLDLVAARSTCKRRAVGAIITDDRNRVLATGYNGTPASFDHCIEHPCLGVDDPPGNTSRCMAVHAEANALLQASNLDAARTIYVSSSPCFSCAKLLANTRIKRVVCRSLYREDMEYTGELVLRQAGVKLVVCTTITTVIK